MHAYGAADDSIDATRLDIGRDDYYGHSGGWLDVQDSLFLRRLGVAQQPLTVSLAGVPGASAVASHVPGIDSPTVCSIAWASGEPMILEARSAEDRRVVRWTGACSGTTTACALTMERPQTAGVVFGPVSYPGRFLVARRGRVTNVALGFSCARSCNAPFDADQTFAFRATPSKGWAFAGWRGDCRGKVVCSLRFDKVHTIRAVFRKRQPLG